MASYVQLGGGENTAIYGLKADHSGIVQADGTTAATLETHALIKLTEDLESFELSASGGTVTATSLASVGDIVTFLDEYAPKSAGAAGETITRYGEGGTPKTFTTGGGAASSYSDLLIIHRGATTNGQIRFTAAVIKLTSNSWDYSTVYNDVVKVPVQGTLVAAKAAITIPNALLPGTGIAAGDMTIASGDPFAIKDYATA